MDPGRFMLYSDFNCPFCYALHERLHNLHLLARCEWRGVQHAPHLPRPMKPWQGSLGAELRHEVAIVQRLAPELSLALPPGKPHTGAAIDLAIVLLRRDRARGMQFVRRAYSAFWCEGKDLSNPQVLDQLCGDPSNGVNAAQTHCARMGIGLAGDRTSGGSCDRVVRWRTSRRLAAGGKDRRIFSRQVIARSGSGPATTFDF